MLRPGIKPVISFTGARDYARSAVASWTNGRILLIKLGKKIHFCDSLYAVIFLVIAM